MKILFTSLGGVKQRVVVDFATYLITVLAELLNEKKREMSKHYYTTFVGDS